MRLSRSEALVLFEWIHRNEDLDLQLNHLGLADQAERVALWSLSAALEKVVPEVFQNDYADTLALARSRLKTDVE